MNTFSMAFQMLRQNKKSIILFELFYKLMCLAVFSPIVYGLFNLSLHLAGFEYLSTDRLFTYITSPFTIAILLIIGTLLTAISLLETAAMIQCFHASYYRYHIRLTEMFQMGLFTMYKLLMGSNFMLILFVVLIVPFTNLTVISGYIGTITIPDFITEYINSHLWLEALVIVVFLILYFFALRWCLSIHCFVLEHGNYRKARAHSASLVSKNYIKNLLCILLWNLLILFFVIIGTLLVSFLAFGLIKLFLPASVDYSAALEAVNIILAVSFELYSIFSIPLTFSYLSALYYEKSVAAGDSIPPYHEKKISRRRLRYSRMLMCCVLAATLLIGIYAGVAPSLNPFSNQNIIGDTQITAHRGDSVTAPENTIPAFESAIDNLADCIELDVAQTKDGVIVVMHDSNLKRITGVSKNIWDITYEELQTYDAGAWFGESFAGTTFPTLDEVLKMGKFRIDFNIELKPTGHETDYEQHVLDVIYENHYENDCVVASSSKTSLQKVKELSEDITTIYIMPLAYGNFAEMDFADGLSVEASSVTKSLVSQIHDSGKSIYAWTVNDERSITRMLALGVDSIVTDNPIRAREIQNTNDLNAEITRAVRELFP